MSACLLCGSDRFAFLFQTSDLLYRTTREEFAVVRCGGCGLIRLDPQPTAAQLRRYYPDAYWFAPGEDTAGRWEEACRRLVLGEHVRFVERALRRAFRAGCQGP